MKARKVLKETRQKGDDARGILTATKLNTRERLAVEKLALFYTKNGDVSQWIRHAILKWRPKESDLHEVKPEKKRQ